MPPIPAALRDANKRQYVATGSFNNNIFSYSTRLDANFNTVGALTVAPGTTTLNCVKGHILRENGRKLITGVNPGLLDPNSGDPYTYLVGVIDSRTFINGFIDPNCSLFAPFNTDKPAFLDNTTEARDGAVDLQDIGPPVYTRGDITTTAGNITAVLGNIAAQAGSVSAATTVSAGTSVSAGTTVTAGTGITSTTGNIRAATGNIVATAGSVSAATTVTARKYLTSPVGSGAGSVGSPLTASCGSANFNGSSYQIVYTTQVTGTSMLFITVNNVGPRAVSAVPNAGYFEVYSSVGSDASTFYWLVIN